MVHRLRAIDLSKPVAGNAASPHRRHPARLAGRCRRRRPRAAPHALWSRLAVPFVIFVEGATAGEPDRVHHVRAGVGLLALRLVDVPIVGLGLAGSDDLYRGKRVAVRLLAPVTARELVGTRLASGAPDGGHARRASPGAPGDRPPGHTPSSDGRRALPADRRPARASPPLALVAWALLTPCGRSASATAVGLGPRAPVALKLLRVVFGLVGRGLLGFKLELVGAEHLPRDRRRPADRWLDRGRGCRT